jgi:hypothetical protein
VDWFGGVRFQQGKVVAEDAAKWQQRCKSFLISKRNESAATRRLPWSKRYRPNEEAIRAFDSSLAGMGLSLAQFQIPRMPQALTAHEERFYIDAEDLPDDMAKDLGLPRRSCIEDMITGDTRFELDLGVHRKTAVNVIDCGSKARPGRMFMFGKGRVRGMLWFDALHTRYNRYKSCVTAADLADSWAEGGVLVGFRKGPWTSGAHFGTLQAIAQNAWQTATHRDSLYRLCYPAIIFFRYRGKLPANAYTEESYSHEWESGQYIQLISNKGSREAKSRWFDMPKQVDVLLPDMGWFRYFSLRRALEENWYTSVYDSPLFQSALAYEPVEPACVVAAPIDGDGQAEGASSSSSSSGPVPRHVDDEVAAAERKTFQQEKQEAKCIAHLACNIACSDTKLRLMVMYAIGSRATSEFHDLTVTQLKTQSGCIEWWRVMATEGWLDVARRQASVFGNADLLQDRGYFLSGANVHSICLA